jgi:hypothetical protein
VADLRRELGLRDEHLVATGYADQLGA